MIQRGYVCFGDGGKKLGERLLPITQPMLDPATLPDRGFPWVEQWAVGMKCLKRRRRRRRDHLQYNDVRGIQAVSGLPARCDPRPHQWRPARQQGGGRSRSWKGTATKTSTARNGNPVFRIINWMVLNGPVPVSIPSTTAPDQPHRRRVARRQCAPKRRGRLQRPRLTFQSSKLSMETCDMMFDPRNLSWGDFEVASKLDLKAVGTLRYATDSQRAQSFWLTPSAMDRSAAWHADGAIPIGPTRQPICAPPTITARHSPSGTQVSTAPSGITGRSTFPSSRQSVSST